MKVPLSYLKEFIDLPQSPEEIAHALTMAGLEEEGIERSGSDIIFEIGLTPNLGHCMSILGIARELSALFQTPLKPRAPSIFQEDKKTSDLVQVQIEAKEDCLQYSVRLVEKVQNGPSPKDLVKKLELLGLRSVNRLVDIGNLVMIETGQPLHLFDFDTLKSPSLKVSSAQGGETITTLDGIKREAKKGALLICNHEKPVAFAGVIGEESTSISPSTSNVLIEAAHFTPEAIRKTVKQLGCRTDSSNRFERGIDPLGIERALDRAAELLEGEVRTPLSILSATYKPKVVSAEARKINRLLGISLSKSEIVTLLERLEIRLKSESETELTFTIPSYRNDLSAEIDLIEEVGRMYGLGNLPRPKVRYASSKVTHSPLYLIEEKAREKLVLLGLQECLTCDLISPKLSAITAERSMGEEARICVLHPASIEQSVLRATLLPSLLEVIRYNFDHQNTSIAAFEVGHIHFKEGKDYISEPSCGIILTGEASPYHFEKGSNPFDFFTLKGYVEDFLCAMGIPNITLTPSHLHNFHPKRQASILNAQRSIGALGQIHPNELAALGIENREIFFAEINLQALLEMKTKQTQFVEFAKTPHSSRDWTLTLDQSTCVGAILEAALSQDSPLLEEVSLIDLYTGKKVAEDQKNATLRFIYRDPKKTLSYEEVQKEHKKLTDHLFDLFSKEEKGS